MTPRLALIAKQMDRREQASAPAPEPSGIGTAIESMIDRAVEERVSAALQEQRKQLQFSKPAPVTDFKQIPPTPRTPAPKAMETQFQRDELGRVNVITVGNLQFHVQRDELGRAVRMVPADNGALPPAVLPAINREA